MQSLAQRLEAMPAGDAGLRSRTAFALAACGARDQEIAAALGISAAMLEEWHAAEIGAGRAMTSVNIRAEILRSATGNGRPFSVTAAKAALRFLSPGAQA
ncbi:hypothetical protein GU700_11010 [Methylobacterium sp. NI91]|nr:MULTISPECIES: hypothetical protein [unclassified Methylobacterium]QIJ75072.1 hypothetical protein CLZ_11010 [Methylobacterium sp. CLZ]QIJ79976.1 hypothetical protein GU700_11010 [Methylobacterium sp. NI91]